jgi:2-amino-4-hydroxy-6-hydroxymethyldihydropteridine diphosphokinase
MPLYVVGVGASGEAAGALVAAGLRDIAALPGVRVRGQSRRYQNPAWGGATRAPFVNAAVVVDAPFAPAPLLRALFAIERAHGRVRTGKKNGARTLDLDVLWSTARSSSTSTSTSTSTPTLPHPRLCERAFAVVPAVEALVAAGVVVDAALVAAARAHATAPLWPLTSTPSSPTPLR